MDGTKGAAGTNSPVDNKIGVPGYPVKVILLNWPAVKVPVVFPKNILPPVPDAPPVPVQPLMVSVVPDHVTAELFAKVRV
jgi:hypothetical protein